MVKITSPAGERRRRIYALLTFVMIAVFAPTAVWAQSSRDPRGLTVSLSAGAARPSDRSFRELYGSVQYPISVQADYEICRHVLAFSGYEYLGRTGNVLETEMTVAPAGDAIRFRQHTLNVGLLYAVPLRRITLLGGGGVGVHFYRETWEGAGVDTRGNKAGFVAQAGAEYALFRNISFLGRVGYSRLVVKAGSSSENNAGLGRLEFTLGLSFRLTHRRH